RRGARAPRGGRAQGREPPRRDRLQIPAAPLDVEDLLGLAETVRLADLDRRVAAAVQHQAPVATEKTRGVDARPEVAVVAGRFFIVPEVLDHGRSLSEPALPPRGKLSRIALRRASVI